MRQPTLYEKAIRTYCLGVLAGFRTGADIGLVLETVGPVGSFVQLGLNEGVLETCVEVGDDVNSVAGRLRDMVNAQSNLVTADGIDDAVDLHAATAVPVMATISSMFSSAADAVKVVYARQAAPRDIHEFVIVRRGKSISEGYVYDTQIDAATDTITKFHDFQALVDVDLYGPRSRAMADALSVGSFEGMNTLNDNGVSIASSEIFDAAAALTNEWEDRSTISMRLNVTEAVTLANPKGAITSVIATGEGVEANTDNCPSS